MDDERENLPSISQLEAMALCPARWQLSQQVPEPPSSPIAAYGDQVHSAMETGETEDLTDEQRELVHEMACQESVLLKDIFGANTNFWQRRETRFWYHRKNGIREKLFSGKLDFSAYCDDANKTSLYIDYKSLWGDTTPPARNLQLRGGAVLLKQNFQSQRVFVAIIQPAKRKFAIVAEYGPEELEQAERQCVDLIEYVSTPNSVFNPGPEQCRYCRAKLICKVAHKESVEELSTIEATPVVHGLTDEHLDRLGHAWEVAQIIGKAIEAEIRWRKEADPNRMSNYQFVPSGHTSEIASPARVWPQFQHLLSQEQFAAACYVGKGRLVEAVRTQTGLSKVRATRVVDELLEPLVVKKPKKPSLQRKPYYEIKNG